MSVQAADSAGAWGSVAIEPSVGASLSMDIMDGLLLQIGLPGAQWALRPAPDMPGVIMSDDGTELVSDSVVSLRIERRAAGTPLPDTAGDKTAGGALLILAQFN